MAAAQGRRGRHGVSGGRLVIFPRALLDTNVLVYTVDASNPDKQRRAAEVLRLLTLEGGGVLSSQCLVEFTQVATRRLPVRLSFGNAAMLVDRFSAACSVYPVVPATVVLACRAVTRYPLSFFDSLIWAAARANQVPVILTEDKPGMPIIEGVRYIDPFEQGFDPASLPD